MQKDFDLITLYARRFRRRSLRASRQDGKAGTLLSVKIGTYKAEQRSIVRDTVNLQDYFSLALRQCDTKELKVGTIKDKNQLLDNLAVNCIPADIFTMTSADYEKFLKERRVLMAKKIKEYYRKL